MSERLEEAKNYKDLSNSLEVFSSFDWPNRPVTESTDFRFECSHIEEFFSTDSFTALLRSIESACDEITVVQSNLLKLDFAAFCGCIPEALASLDLSKHAFQNVEVELLCNSLRRLTALKNLKLSYCRLQDTHITSLSACFPFLRNLRTLNLEGNRITQAFNISPLMHLEDLNLNNNDLPQAQWNLMTAQLKLLPAKSVRVWRTVIDDEMMRDIREIAQRREREIDTLELIDVQLPDGFDEWLQTIKCKKLTISNGQNLPEQIRINTGIIHLDLSYCSLKSCSLEHLSRCFFDIAQCLMYLNISGNFCNKVSATSLSGEICALYNLTHLEIANLCSDADTFAHLLRGVKMPRLLTLNASGNVNTGGIEVCTALAESLELVKTLKHLDLSDNTLGDISLLRGKMNEVESLNLDNTSVSLTDPSTVHTLVSMRSLKSLRLSGVTKLLDGAQRLVPLALRSLSITESSTVPEVFRALIFRESRLVDLDLTNTNLKNKCLEALFDCLPTTLQVLNLSHTKCGNQGCEAIERNSNLLQQLRTLRLAHNKIDERGAERLFRTIGLLKELRCLDLSANRIKNEAFTYLERYENSYLTELDLSHNPLTLKDLDLPGKFRFLVDYN